MPFYRLKSILKDAVNLKAANFTERLYRKKVIIKFVKQDHLSIFKKFISITLLSIALSACQTTPDPLPPEDLTHIAQIQGFDVRGKIAIITPKDKDSINFYGKIVSADANEFISYDYDLLINYFGDNEILTLISSKTNSNFRVGYSESNKNINDIMFSNFFNNFEKFSNELIKYLKFLKWKLLEI